MILSLEMALIIFFSTISAEAKNLPTVKLTPRSKICLVIIVALMDFFKTPTTCGYFLCLTFFLTFGSESSMVWSELG